MRRIVAIAVMLCLCLCMTGCEGNSGDTSSSRSQSEPTSSKNSEWRRPVEYALVKDQLVGGYSCGENASEYSYDYIFFDDGGYIVIEPIGKRYTQDNSEAKFFLKDTIHGERIIVSITHEDGTEIELEATYSAIDTENNPFPGIRVSDEHFYSNWKNDIPSSPYYKYYEIEDFENFEIGKSTYRDIASELNNYFFIIYLTPTGDMSEVKTTDGKYIWIRYDENQVVTAIEVSDSPCEVYF